MVSLELLKRVILGTLLRKHFKGTNGEAKSSIKKQLRGDGASDQEISRGGAEQKSDCVAPYTK